ncbi:MFS transporter [Kitasatospora sp. NPDC054939]
MSTSKPTGRPTADPTTGATTERATGTIGDSTAEPTAGTTADVGTREPAPAPPNAVHRLWLAGSTASLLGDAVLHFALGWAASARGGGAAALVLTAVTVPRTALLLLGGAVADRFGTRRVLLAGDAVMLAATLVVAAAGSAADSSLWFLVAVAAVVGTVDAFHLPATGAVLPGLVPDERLSRALAVQQAGRQSAALLGAPLGAGLVAVGGLSGAALFDAATFALMLVVLTALGRLSPPRPDGGDGDGNGGGDGGRGALGERSLFGSVADGVRLVAGDRALRAALLLTAAAAGSLLPVVSLLGPLLVRSHGWSAQTAGLVAGAQSIGIIAVSVLVARRGTAERPAVRACSGLGVAAAGAAGLAVAPTAGAAVAAALGTGVGSGVFATHIGPVLLTGAPGSHLARVQAAATFVQSLALVATTNVLGLVADTAGANAATLTCALALTLTATAGLAATSLRRLTGRPPQADPPEA